MIKVRKERLLTYKQFTKEQMMKIITETLEDESKKKRRMKFIGGDKKAFDEAMKIAVKEWKLP